MFAYHFNYYLLTLLLFNVFLKIKPLYSALEIQTLDVLINKCIKKLYVKKKVTKSDL